MSKYSIDNDLDDGYVTYLYEKIPILEKKNKEGVELLQLVLNYIESTEKGLNTQDILDNIKNSIKYIVNQKQPNIRNGININAFNNNNKEFINGNKKYTKRYPIKALALIEGIILVTLNYYQQNFPNTEIIITNSEKKNNTKKINFVMNKVQGINLGNYILNLYKTKNSIKKKETITFSLLQKIAEKLKYLQDNFNFIHGDFHSGNIFIEKNWFGYNITFIDVEYSTIKLPTKNNKTIILTSPLNENMSRKKILNINKNKEPELKALDLFHLIQDIKSFDNPDRIKNINNKKKIDELKELISKLSKLYKIPCKLSKKLHNSTRISGFFNDNYSKLIPENFIKIKNIDSINNLKRKINNLNVKNNSVLINCKNGYATP